MARCEFDPETNEMVGYHPDDGCQRQAVLYVKGEPGSHDWNLCAECAGLPRFERAKKTSLAQRAFQERCRQGLVKAPIVASVYSDNPDELCGMHRCSVCPLLRSNST